MSSVRVAALCLAMGVLAAPMATAQQTRAALIAAAQLARAERIDETQQPRAAAIAESQAAKARDLKPYVSGKAERVALNMKRRLFDTPEGFYPWGDSVYGGGGFTLGAGYRKFVGDHAFVDARGLLSAKAYKLVELATGSLGPPRRLDVRGAGGWRDATQVSFFGVGSETTPETKSNFRMQQGFAGVTARWRITPLFFADAALRYENYTLLPGDGASPSIEQSYTATTAPGLGASPDYVRTTLGGGFDWRTPSRGYARHGGLYAVTYDIAADQDSGAYSFEVLQTEIVQHFPILRENWIVSVHGVMKTTVDDDDTVPYFLLPALGSGSTLRAFSSWRFRDRHSLLVSGEWRWLPSRLFLDVALFYDAGKVAARRADLNFDGLTHNWGIGVRFHSPLATPLRIEIAHGREGVNLVFSGAAAF